MSTGSAMIVSAACIHSTFRAWMDALDAGTIRKRQDQSFIDALATAAVGFVKVQQTVYEFQVRNGTEEDQADIKALFRSAEQMIEDARPYLKESVRNAVGSSSFTLRDILIYQSGGPDPEVESGEYAGTLDEDGGDRWFEDTILGKAWTDSVQKVSASTPVGSAAIAELEHLPDMKQISAHSSLFGSVMDFVEEITSEAQANKEEGPIEKRPRTPIAVSKRGKPTVTTNIAIAVDIPDNMTITGKLYTAFHRSVLDAIDSIYLYGDSGVFTVDQVCRVMNNRTNQEDPGEAYRAAVQQAIDDMLCMRVYIDATNEVKMRHLQEDGGPHKVTFNRQFLDLDGVTVEAGGKEVRAYKFVRMPAMLEYCSRVNQITTVSASVLDIRKTDKEGRLTTVSISTSPRRTVIRDFLMREVQAIKNAAGKTKRKGFNVIKLERIYAAAEVNASDKVTKKRVRSYTEDVMKSWTASGYIKGWNWRKKGNVYEALVIDP